MFRIIVCDDDPYVCEWFSLAINMYCIERNFVADLRTTESIKQLIKFLDDGFMPDILFLDIILPEGNSISLVKELVKRIKDCKTVLITATKDYTLEGYSIHAYDYLIKPIKDDVVFKLIEDVSQSTPKRITIRVRAITVEIRCEDLVYIESNKHALIFHTTGKEMTSYGKLNVFDDLLRDTGVFIRCHQSYLINSNYVKEVKNNTFIMLDGAIIPIRKRDSAAIKRNYYSLSHHSNS